LARESEPKGRRPKPAESATEGDIPADPALDQTRLRLALQATGLGIWDWDLTTGAMTWTEPAKTIYGFPPGEAVTFEQVRAATHPDDLPRTSAMSRRALDPAQKAKEPYEFRIILPGGEVRWIDAHGEAVFATVDGVERAVRYTGTVQDITQRKRAEEDLRIHALLLERMSEGVSLSLEDGTIVYTNEAEDRMFGYRPGELIGQNVAVQNAYPSEENARRVAATIAHLSRHGAWEGELLNRRKDGSEFVTDARISGVEIGGRRHWLCVQRDVTEARRMEAATRASEARLRLAIDAAQLAVWEFDGKTDTLVGSPELNRIFGLPLDRPATIAEIRAGYYPGEGERIRAAALQSVQSGERNFQTEFRYTGPNGDVRWLLLRAELLPDESGELTRALGVVIDITDQKRTEEAQQVLISELNHRVKNTLAIVNSIAAQTLRDAADPAHARTAFLARIGALAEAHDVLTRRNWSGARLGEIAAAVLQPHIAAQSKRITFEGPEVSLSPQSAVALSMVLHELATNALKYGALSSASGSVVLEWRFEEPTCRSELTLCWRESGGPKVTPPQRKGFGSRCIERGWAASGDTEVHLEFQPEGLVCTLVTRRREAASLGEEW
jgi:PAS domain S-box-containing protein